MFYQARELRYRGDPADYSEEHLGRFYRDDPAFSDDLLLTIAYAISEQAIALLGPIFWVLLGYLFPVDEFGR